MSLSLLYGNNGSLDTSTHGVITPLLGWVIIPVKPAFFLVPFLLGTPCFVAIRMATRLARHVELLLSVLVLRWSKTLPEMLVWKRAMKTITMTPSNYQIVSSVSGSRILRYPFVLDIPGQVICVDQFPPVLPTQMVMKSGKVRESLPKYP